MRWPCTGRSFRYFCARQRCLGSRPGPCSPTRARAGQEPLPGRAPAASAPAAPARPRCARSQWRSAGRPLRRRRAQGGSGQRSAAPGTAPACQRRPRGACSMDSDSAELSEGELVSPAGPDYFSSKNLALQAQKKILSKMATKTMANMLIDDTSSEIFDELYKVTKEHTRNKKEAHKIMKDLIKVAIKIGILYRNNQFNQEELEIVDKFRKKLNQTAMTIVSFYEVEYTFDRNVLAELLNECKELVHELVGQHLTARSHGRINHVFNHFADVEFLSALYSLDGDCRPYLKKICNGINKLLDEKVL
ncbi:tumor necrosis factor alpha-induced protein 8-like protein 3 [Molothrus ater]|uniref:tumor necrosis factor alpha-induced protein 8-like protein 3 n=1 Tax=Molothrus ater TaxID=84834 RepID=UPI0023E8FB80|nr:tumor necrosis factor alpha-induced protein 8-like protein 3 [Molothrus ater]